MKYDLKSRGWRPHPTIPKHWCRGKWRVLTEDEAAAQEAEVDRRLLAFALYVFHSKFGNPEAIPLCADAEKEVARELVEAFGKVWARMVSE